VIRSADSGLPRREFAYRRDARAQLRGLPRGGVRGGECWQGEQAVYLALLQASAATLPWRRRGLLIRCTCAWASTTPGRRSLAWPLRPGLQPDDRVR